MRARPARRPRATPRPRLVAAAAVAAFAAGCADAGPPSPPRRAEGGSTYDVIVVGSGAGGGPLAARLARAGRRVLLLEAGEDTGGTLKYQVPAMHALSTEDPDAAWWFFVKHSSDPAVDRADSKATPAGVLYPRGSALGGSTAVNALVTVLPSRSDWDRLAALTGDAGFGAGAMDRYVDRVRSWLSVELPDPGLALGDARIAGYLRAAARASAAEPGGDPGGFDPFAAGSALGSLAGRDLNAALRRGETTGLFRLPLATRGGRRNGPREFVLDTVAAGHPLTVVTGAFVTRVLWAEGADRPTAAGVEFVRAPKVYGASLDRREAPPERHRAFAARDVVLAAGAFNTPQLLLLSGVGDAAALRAAGVAPVLDRPGVGANLQDRYEAPLVAEFARPIDAVARCRLAAQAGAGPAGAPDPCLDDWRRGEGVYATPGFLATALLRSSSSPALADLQAFAVPSDARGYYPGYSNDGAEAKNRFSWLLLKARAANRDGRVALADASPFSRPDIHFHSYDETNPLADPDLLAVVEGLKFARRVQAEARAVLPDDPPAEVWPGPAVATDAALAAWVRKESWGHHACCTSKMGRADDPTAVVDSHFRVVGADRLRVVDASVFPEIPGTFLAFPTFLLAERAADVLAEDEP